MKVEEPSFLFFIKYYQDDKTKNFEMLDIQNAWFQWQMLENFRQNPQEKYHLEESGVSRRTLKRILEKS